MNMVGTSYTRVEDHTHPAINTQIADQTASIIEYFADHPDEIDARLAELDEEWDVERWLQFNSATLSLFGLGMSIVGSRKWLLLPVAVQSFFMQHGVQGWCPPLPVFRRMGIRTTREIEAERTALLKLRDDIDEDSESEDAAFRTLDRLREAWLDGKPEDDRRAGLFGSTHHRVRRRTDPSVNASLDRQTERRVAYYSRHPKRARRRLAELEKEWDIERIIEVHGPTLSLSGIALAVTRGKGWLALPMLVQALMATHAVKGHYPPLSLMRRMGLRTFEEIHAERTAILISLGEFDAVAEVGAARGKKNK